MNLKDFWIVVMYFFIDIRLMLVVVFIMYMILFVFGKENIGLVCRIVNILVFVYMFLIL